MSEFMDVFRTGERLATMDSEGRVTVWVVQRDGRMTPQRPPEHHETRGER